MHVKQLVASLIDMPPIILPTSSGIPGKCDYLSP